MPHTGASVSWAFVCAALVLRSSLPRVGVSTALHAGLDHVAWYGKGPHECYWDRQEGAHLGLHAAAVRDMHTPYVFPQASPHVWPLIDRTRNTTTPLFPQ